MRRAMQYRVIFLVATLGLVAVGCSSGSEDSSDSTSAVDVNGEPQDSNTTPAGAETSLSEGAINSVEPHSPLTADAEEASNELDDPREDPNELFGMRPYTGWDSVYIGLEGILIIEHPCAYLYPQDHVELLYPQEGKENADPAAPSGKRVLLSLVRDWTDYNHETNTITLRDVHHSKETDSYVIGPAGSGDGPIASGDRINVAGIARVDLGHDSVCQRDYDITVDQVSLCRLHACRIEREARQP